MTQREKMLAGALYDPADAELSAARAEAKKLCGRLNRLLAEDPAGLSIFSEVQTLMGRLFGKTNPTLQLCADFWCDYGFNITFGKNCFANHHLVILDCAKVTFGNGVLIGPNCGFYTAEHPLDAALRRQGYETARPITVGNDVWFGGGVTVLAGVTIGDRAVIGAGSVVTRDIPADAVAAGNPCKVIRIAEPS